MKSQEHSHLLEQCAGIERQLIDLVLCYIFSQPQQIFMLH